MNLRLNGVLVPSEDYARVKAVSRLLFPLTLKDTDSKQARKIATQYALTTVIGFRAVAAKMPRAKEARS